jgi:hypothetical protein
MSSRISLNCQRKVLEFLQSNIDHSCTQESRTSNISNLPFSKVGNTKGSLISFSVYQFLLEGSKVSQPLRGKTLSLCQPSCFFFL